MLKVEMCRKSSRRVKLTVALFILSATLFHRVAASGTQFFNSGNEQTTLIELFTSQGCSSCPPAERWLGDLKDDPRLWKEIIPVAFHVDYWDYIGWRDTYAHPEHSARQRRYRSENGIGSVYTPGFVVNGQEWRGWFKNQPLPLANTTSGELRVTLTNNRQLDATYTAAEQTGQALTLNVALLAIGLQADVERGENAGRRLPQDFTVLQLIELTSSVRNWTATLPDNTMPGNASPAIAMWISAEGTQKPLQAVGGWLVN